MRVDKTIRLHSQQEGQLLVGPCDEYLSLIAETCSVKIALRGGHLKLSGTATHLRRAAAIVEELLMHIRSGSQLERALVYALVKGKGRLDPDAGTLSGASRMRVIGPKTAGQREYVEAIRACPIVFGLGPAGTGKTYLAMACAVEALKKQEVRRIILTRPAIEAGESLGFLPGDIHAKISPYLRPLYDAIYDMMDAERIEKYLETGIIEVAPLAYMRGRTLNDAFIILDEAQNCTAEQLKMFLTRLGFDSKAVITGDPTQSDLAGSRPVGLLQAQKTLNGIDGIQFIYFSGSDVVRHPLVQRIIEAYDKAIPQRLSQ